MKQKRPNIIFSIIIPAYNVESYLSQCLDSILSQDFKDFEIIIVNDQSTDSTKEIIREYSIKDDRITSFDTEINTGNPFKARKLGIDRAIGEYVVMIDADDFVSHDYLSRLYDKISITHADIVLTEMWKGNEGDYTKILPTSKIDTQKTYKGRDLIVNTLNEWSLSTNGLAIKKDIILKSYDIFPTVEIDNFFSDELLDRWCFLISQSVCFVDSKYFYRINSESITHKNSVKSFLKMSKRNDALLKFCEEYFSKDSIEFHKANSQIILHVINGFFLAKEIKDKKEKQILLSEMQRIKSSLDVSIKDYLSFPYRLILSSPGNTGIYLASIVKWLKKLKDK